MTYTEFSQEIWCHLLIQTNAQPVYHHTYHSPEHLLQAKDGTELFIVSFQKEAIISIIHMQKLRLG